MNYVGKWEFHSIGIMNENDEFVFMSGDEYLNSPMPYIDETDEDEVAHEMKERKQTVESKLAISEDGNLYMLMPFPEGVSKAEIDEAVAAGHIKVYDDMMTSAPCKWENRNGELWVDLGIGDEFVKASDESEYLTIMTTRYVKIN